MVPGLGRSTAEGIRLPTPVFLGFPGGALLSWWIIHKKPYIEVSYDYFNSMGMPGVLKEVKDFVVQQGGVL